MAETPLPSNWGITTPDRLLSSLRVAETGGDIAECADALEWMLRSGRLVDREAIDYERMAKAIYKDYEGCPDSYVEQVWSWESIPENDKAGLEARDAFRQTVEEFTASAHHAVDAALGEV